MVSSPQFPNPFPTPSESLLANEILTERHGRILQITLNRPEAKNAVNAALADALVATMETLNNDDDLTVGVLTGADGGFS